MTKRERAEVEELRARVWRLEQLLLCGSNELLSVFLVELIRRDVWSDVSQVLPAHLARALTDYIEVGSVPPPGGAWLN